MSIWNYEDIKKSIDDAYVNSSEIELLDILKKNSFLFHELYTRKMGIQPNFCEVSFGSYKCDFAWLEDSSSGPEWVLVEIEKPNLKLFTKSGDPAKDLNHAIEQVRSWKRYFKNNPAEKKRIFGAVARFRYILIAGEIKDWLEPNAIKWRQDNNEDSDIEIRTMDIFTRALEILRNKPKDLWSFEENPISLKSNQLVKYWSNYSYMDLWRKIL